LLCHCSISHFSACSFPQPLIGGADSKPAAIVKGNSKPAAAATGESIPTASVSGVSQPATIFAGNSNAAGATAANVDTAKIVNPASKTGKATDAAVGAKSTAGVESSKIASISAATTEESVAATVKGTAPNETATTKDVAADTTNPTKLRSSNRIKSHTKRSGDNVVTNSLPPSKKPRAEEENPLQDTDEEKDEPTILGHEWIYWSNLGVSELSLDRLDELLKGKHGRGLDLVLNGPVDGDFNLPKPEVIAKRISRIPVQGQVPEEASENKYDNFVSDFVSAPFYREVLKRREYVDHKCALSEQVEMVTKDKSDEKITDKADSKRLVKLQNKMQDKLHVECAHHEAATFIDIGMSHVCCVLTIVEYSSSSFWLTKVNYWSPMLWRLCTHVSSRPLCCAFLMAKHASASLQRTLPTSSIISRHTVSLILKKISGTITISSCFMPNITASPPSPSQVYLLLFMTFFSRSISGLQSPCLFARISRPVADLSLTVCLSSVTWRPERRRTARRTSNGIEPVDHLPATSERCCPS